MRAFLALVVCLAFSMASTETVGDGAGRYVKLFEKTYRSAKTMRATFLERYLDQGKLERAESGIAYFRKPGKMRWEYSAPEKNLFLIDGKTAWFYVPADHTVTRMPAKKSEDWRTPLALLAGEVKVSRICENVTIDSESQSGARDGMDTVVLRCALKGVKRRQGTENALTGSSQPDLVQFEVERATGELRRVRIHEPGGIEVDFEFANWEFDPPVPESSFHFEPPKGVAIVNGDPDAVGAGGGR